jgi:hypothetical protein
MYIGNNSEIKEIGTNKINAVFGGNSGAGDEPQIVWGLIHEMPAETRQGLQVEFEANLKKFDESSFLIQSRNDHGKKQIIVAATANLGLMFGIYQLCEKKQIDQLPADLVTVQIPVIKRRMFAATIKYLEHIPRLFDQMLASGMNEFVIMNLDNCAKSTRELKGQGRMGSTLKHADSFMFGMERYPKFKEYVDWEEIDRQQQLLDGICAYGAKIGVKLTFLLPVPKFPTNTVGNVQACYPELFQPDGKFNLTSEFFHHYLRDQMEEIVERYPALTGFEIWLAEGTGRSVCGYGLKELETLGDFLPQWLEIIDDVSRKHGMEVGFFTHHYEHSVETRTKMYDLLAKYPDWILMEDITWPEEHLSLPTLGSISEPLIDKLVHEHKSKLNFLLDTEYMGQGILPTVLPYWIKKHMDYCVRRGITGVHGRILRWDGFNSFDNHNLGNIYAFGKLAWNNESDPDEVLSDYLALRYGRELAGDLYPIFSQCERLIESMLLINGIGVADHSQFPQPTYISSYHSGRMYMKPIEDLFKPAGTRLYSDKKNIIHNEQWRYQLKLHAQSMEEMVAAKEDAIRLSEEALERLAGLRDWLVSADYEELRLTFETCKVVSDGMKLFLRLAYCDYYNLLEQRDEILAQLTDLGNEVERRYGYEFYFRLSTRLRSFAEYFRKL